MKVPPMKFPLLENIGFISKKAYEKVPSDLRLGGGFRQDFLRKLQLACH